MCSKESAMSRVKLSRREREKSRHKEEISEAALTLFSEKGFHNVSMQVLPLRRSLALVRYIIFSRVRMIYSRSC